MFHLFTNRRFLLIALVILLITWVMFVSSQEKTCEGKIHYFFNSAMIPLESLFNSIGNTATGSWETIITLSTLKEENDRLKTENDKLKAHQTGLDLLRAENRRLRSSLQYMEDQPHVLIPAEIISVNPNNWNWTVVINKGKNFQIAKNMAVITPRGVVGRIGEVRGNNADVILMTDPRDGNFIGGVVSRTGNMVIVTGGGQYRGECSVKPAVESYFSNITIGDLVVTSETSEIYPRGIPIGRISQITKMTNNLVSKASLKPAVNLGLLQTVYVIKEKRDQ
ncbi:MAG: rod shape-determining protein MreC [Firmicutes bacterium]|nr:rod shape-determining protein MreC [Bacillota bacterium]